MTPALPIDLDPPPGPVTKFRNRASSWLQTFTVLIALTALVVGTLGVIPKCGDIQSKTLAAAEHKEIGEKTEKAIDKSVTKLENDIRAVVESNQKAHESIINTLEKDRDENNKRFNALIWRTARDR